MELEKEVKALASVKQMSPAARTRQDEADRLKAEAEALKDKARLEDLHLWQMKKAKRTGKKDTRTYTYWMASWREGRRGTECPSRQFQEDRCRGSQVEGPKDESRGFKGYTPKTRSPQALCFRSISPAVIGLTSSLPARYLSMARSTNPDVGEM